MVKTFLVIFIFYSSVEAQSLRMSFSGLPERPAVTFAIKSAETSIKKLCAEILGGCADIEPVHLEFVDEGISVDDVSYAGFIFYDTNTIRISLRSEDLSRTTFHELVHWIHYHYLKDDSILPWFRETVVFLAELCFYERPKITTVEKRYLTSHLEGSLVFNELSSSWYSLVKLWSRYLYSHLEEPKKLLFNWLTISKFPDVWMTQLSFESYKFLGEATKILSHHQKSFENLFFYFIIALHADNPRLDQWKLYSLGLPYDQRLVYVQNRFLQLTSGACIILKPFEFFVANSDVLEANELKGNSIRAILWNEARAPIDILNKRISAVDVARNKIIVFNPSLQNKKLCIEP